MTPFNQGWYLATFAVAMRVHRGHQGTRKEPHWSFLQRCAQTLVRQFPDATRAQVQAVLLHEVLADALIPANQLRGHGIDDDTRRILHAITPPDRTQPFKHVQTVADSEDVDAMRVMLAVNLTGMAEHGGIRYELACQLLSCRLMKDHA